MTILVLSVMSEVAGDVDVGEEGEGQRRMRGRCFSLADAENPEARGTRVFFVSSLHNYRSYRSGIMKTSFQMIFCGIGKSSIMLMFTVSTEAWRFGPIHLSSDGVIVPKATQLPSQRS
jgi:hypothetical protein